MKRYNIKYSETFFEDLQSIIIHIIEVTGNPEIARSFYELTLNVITKRSFSADCYEQYQPFEGSEMYYRIYFGNYVIFYILKDCTMDVRRMLWSGMNTVKHL